MMHFSIGTGLERAGIAERSVGSRCRTPLQKQETKMIGGGSPVAFQMPKSVLYGGREDQQLREGSFVRTFHRWGGLVFIVDDFPNWMVIKTLSYYMRDFLSLSLSN